LLLRRISRDLSIVAIAMPSRDAHHLEIISNKACIDKRMKEFKIRKQI